jgi:DNA-binding beta-propeller fold protein YncE
LDGTPIWIRPVSGPWGVAVEGATGDVFVSQHRARVVIVYDTSGNIVRRVGATTRSNHGEPGFFNGPAGLTVVGGWLVVTDPENNRFQVSAAAAAAVTIHHIGRLACLLRRRFPLSPRAGLLNHRGL